jgi:hypothetical protein
MESLETPTCNLQLAILDNKEEQRRGVTEICGWQHSFKREAMYLQTNNSTRSRNHCCREKAVSITYSECVSVALRYPACKAYAPYYTAICVLSVSTTFLHIIS